MSKDYYIALIEEWRQEIIIAEQEKASARPYVRHPKYGHYFKKLILFYDIYIDEAICTIERAQSIGLKQSD